ncbi:family 78 glycoside hydrolase catalytic domain [Aeromicrobium sp.]|uniref:family 78 glycoside hydrolase catalytic domain n=1 Tax=Aeromicrobium sp. TaxID=1871063 RepID=UPI003FA5411B
MQPSRLRCEHREDVPCVDTPAPRFAWTLNADGRNRRQTAYQIRVWPDGAAHDDPTRLFWDSGMVESSETLEIPYSGLPLPPASTFVWTVRVRDESDIVHGWAEPALFRTALDSWGAVWIRHNPLVAPSTRPSDDASYPAELLDREEPSPYMRREFQVDSEISRATLYVTARGLVEVQVNGQRVGDNLLDPGWTDYHKRIEYQAHDVTAYVRNGPNAIGAILGTGWYAGHVGFDHEHPSAWYGHSPELLCEVRIEHADGRTTIVTSDGSWRATRNGPIRYSDLLHGERIDARYGLGGWSKPNFDDTDWSPVLVSETPEVPIIVPARAQPIRVTAQLKPISVTQQASDTFTFDLGQNMVGWVRLAVQGPRGTRLELRFAEMLDRDGSIYTANLRSARAQDTFVLAGTNEIEVFEPHFTFHGFRYVEVRGEIDPLLPENLTGLVVSSDTPQTGSFTCSDEMVNQLQRNIEWGQRGNFISVPTDCPQRDERLGWLGDAQIFLPTASLNMDIDAFVSKWGDDVLDAQSPSGAYSDVAPRIVASTDGAPAWADAGVIVPWTHYRRYGDLRMLRRHWPHMERYLAYIERENPKLLWSREGMDDYGDWLSVDEHTPPEVIATAYWAHDASIMAQAADVLGNTERKIAYQDLYGRISKAFNDAYVDDDGRIRGNTQTGYVLALAFGVLPAEKRAKAAAHLVENIEDRGWHLATGFLGAGHLCPVLTESGYPDVAHRLLLQDTYPSWGYSIRHGATTIWERWDGWTKHAGFQTPEMNSFNHYSLGAIGAWLFEYVGGIRQGQDEFTYENVLIAPVPGDLAYARTTYRSVRGTFVSDWVQADSRFTLKVDVPPNTRATLTIPAGSGPLLEGGSSAQDAAGVTSVQRDEQFWTTKITSGHYEFQALGVQPARGPKF